MSISKEVVIDTDHGQTIKVFLYSEAGRDVSTLIIGGVRHHFERIKREEFVANYHIDDDPAYNPESDAEDYCYILVPFST